MGITKNATIRYNTLDRCFRNPGKRYYIEDLLEACNESLLEFDPNCEGVKKRQLQYDIIFMESSQGFSIPLEKLKEGKRIYYRYEDLNFSISNQPINELEAEQLKSAMLVLSRFKGLPQFGWVNELLPKLDQSFKFSNQSQEIISFDTNEFLKGTEYITPLFNAILYKQALNIVYMSFKNNEAQTILMHPYHLKQFNNRWFLFGQHNDYNNLTNLALDRIQSIEQSNKPYIPNNIINFEEYFEDIIGVTKPEGAVLTKIVLWVNLSLAPYIKTKPLHGSQKKIEDNDDGYKFSIEVIPNFELEKLIMSYGEDLIVKEPADFRQKMKERISKNINNYNQCS